MIIYLGENLLTLRRRDNLTQREFAEILDVKPASYGNYETGYSQPDYQVLYKISKSLNIPVDVLLYTQLSEIGNLGAFLEVLKSPPNCPPNCTPNDQKEPADEPSAPPSDLSGRNLETAVWYLMREVKQMREEIDQARK